MGDKEKEITEAVIWSLELQQEQYSQIQGFIFHDLLVLLSTNLIKTVLFLSMLSCLSHVQLFATLWTIACQAPLSMGFSKQEYYPSPSPGALSDLGIEPGSPALQADSLPSEPPGKP